MKGRIHLFFLGALVLLLGALASYVGSPAGSADGKTNLAPQPKGSAPIMAALDGQSEASMPPIARGETIGPEDWRSDFSRARAAAWAPPAASSQSVVSNPAPRVPLPLVLLDPDPTADLNDRQLAVLQDLREQFAEAVGGPGQDPRDPAYQERWKVAQAEFDGRVKSWLGSSVYLSLQRSAAAELAGSITTGY